MPSNRGVDIIFKIDVFTKFYCFDVHFTNRRKRLQIMDTLQIFAVTPDPLS